MSDDALNLESVSMRNFMSYGNATVVVNLQRPGTTLIVGEDVETGISNGSGKTTILNGITYALFDRPISKELKLDELINNVNKKNMEVGIKFNKGGKHYDIMRYRKGKDGNTVKLFIDGVDCTRDSVDRTNQYIVENIIGYSYDLFVRIVVFSAGHEPFFSLPTSGAKKPTQSDIIEELFSITVLAQKAALLKEEIKDSERKLELMKVRVDQIDKEKTRHDHLINNTQTKLTDWDDAQDMKIIATQKQLKAANSINYDVEELAHKGIASLEPLIEQITYAREKVSTWNDTHAFKIKSIQSKIDDVAGIDFDKEEALLNELELYKRELDEQTIIHKNLLSKATQDIKTIKKLINEHKSLLDNKCPYCLQDYLESKNRAVELQITINELQQAIKITDDDAVAIEDKILVAEDAIKDIQSHTKYGIKALLTLKNDATTLNDRLESLQSETNPFETLLEKLIGNDDVDVILTNMKKQLLEHKSLITTKSLDDLMSLKSSRAVLQSRVESILDEVNPHVSALSELKKVVLDDPQYDEINDLQKVVDHQKFLVKLLTKSDSFVRKAIIDKNIPLLNQRLKKNLSELGLPHKVEFTNTMTASITQLGRPISYHGLSTGQRARINLALSFAFRDVLQKMHSPVNFCLLDEVLDVGLCQHGTAAAIRMLKTKAKEENMTMFVISHKMGEDSGFGSTLKVQFSGGFSSIVQ
jgi:DNA repair exonuclease SbcCD ATPase subunit